MLQGEGLRIERLELPETCLLLVDLLLKCGGKGGLFVRILAESGELGKPLVRLLIESFLSSVSSELVFASAFKRQLS